MANGTNDDAIDVPESEEIDVQTLSDLGLDSVPEDGDPCSSEGSYTCGTLSRVFKCEDGRWRRTSRSC